MNKWLIFLLLLIGAVLFLFKDRLFGASMTLEHEGDKYPYSDEINYAANFYGIPADLIAAVIRQESNFNAQAANPSDPSYGLMQVTPYIANHYGYLNDISDPSPLYDPTINIMAGSAYLAELLSKYDLDTALQCYNEGEPNFEAGKRVESYASAVEGYYAEYSSSQGD